MYIMTITIMNKLIRNDEIMVKIEINVVIVIRKHIFIYLSITVK